MRQAALPAGHEDGSGKTAESPHQAEPGGAAYCRGRIGCRRDRQYGFFLWWEEGDHYYRDLSARSNPYWRRLVSGRPSGGNILHHPGGITAGTGIRDGAHENGNAPPPAVLDYRFFLSGTTGQ